MSLHTQEDGVSCEARQTSFNVWLASQLLRLSIKIVQRPHRLLKLLFVDLKKTEAKGKAVKARAWIQAYTWTAMCLQDMLVETLSF